MRYFSYIGIGLCLIICQTSLMPHIPFIGVFFDLLLPLVIFLAAFRPVHESLPFTLFLGLLMDSLSGGPFGLFLTSYLWLSIGVRLAATVIRAENPFLLILILMACVVLQNALFIAVVAVFAAAPAPLEEALQKVSEQIGWVLLAGPFLASLMRRANRMRARRIRPADPLQQSTESV